MRNLSVGSTINNSSTHTYIHAHTHIHTCWNNYSKLFLNNIPTYYIQYANYEQQNYNIKL